MPQLPTLVVEGTLENMYLLLKCTLKHLMSMLLEGSLKNLMSILFEATFTCPCSRRHIAAYMVVPQLTKGTIQHVLNQIMFIETIIIQRYVSIYQSRVQYMCTSGVTAGIAVKRIHHVSR